MNGRVFHGFFCGSFAKLTAKYRVFLAPFLQHVDKISCKTQAIFGSAFARTTVKKRTIPVLGNTSISENGHRLAIDSRRIHRAKIA